VLRLPARGNSARPSGGARGGAGGRGPHEALELRRARHGVAHGGRDALNTRQLELWGGDGRGRQRALLAVSAAASHDRDEWEEDERDAARRMEHAHCHHKPRHDRRTAAMPSHG
jgi:hypothetical protein